MSSNGKERFGTGSTWSEEVAVAQGVECSGVIFGDPRYGVENRCECQARPYCPDPPACEPGFFSSDGKNGGGDKACFDCTASGYYCPSGSTTSAAGLVWWAFRAPAAVVVC